MQNNKNFLVVIIEDGSIRIAILRQLYIHLK